MQLAVQTPIVFAAAVSPGAMRHEMSLQLNRQ
jgi:hypothetical protein